jgi:arylsulfatase A
LLTKTQALKTKLIFLLVSLFSLCLSAQQKPNIIFFSAENFGPGDLDQTRVPTPNIHALLKLGTRFNSFYAASSLLSPAQSAIFTGSKPNENPVKELIYPGSKTLSLSDTSTSLAQILTKEKYATAFFGTWALGDHKSKTSPKAMGFQYFCGQMDPRYASNRYPKQLWLQNEALELPNSEISTHTPLPPGSDFDNDELYKSFNGVAYAPQLIHDKAIDFLDSRLKSKESFFLYYSHPALSPSLQTREKYLGPWRGTMPDLPYAGQNAFLPHKYPRAVQCAQLTELDRHLGEILVKLKASKQLDNTFFVFTSSLAPSDRGGRDLKFFSSLQDFRGSRGSFYEAGLRLPCIGIWPKLLTPGKMNEDSILQSSLYKSAISIAKKENSPIFLPSSRIIWETTSHLVVRDGDLKLIEKKAFLSPATTQLYDLKADPKEAIDLSKDRLKALADLRTLAQPVKE